MTRIYLDHNATAPLRLQVRDAMLDAMQGPVNASSVHAEGRAARHLLERSRRTLAETLGAFPGEIIFTSGGTEANVLALHAATGRPCAVSAVEHASVLENAPGAALLAVDSHGRLRLDRLESWLGSNPSAFISVQLANNETGVIQPVAEIARMVHRHGGVLHVDGAQGFGRIETNFGLLEADYLSICAHKCGGPQGIGALVASQKAPLPPLLRGRQENGRRAGTVPVALAVGFACAASLLDADRSHLHALRGWLDAMEADVLALGGTVFGRGAPRLPNVSCLGMPGMSGEMQVIAFDLAGIAVSAGAACASGKTARSHVLLAMEAGLLAEASVRISGGWSTVKSDICESFATWRKLYENACSTLDNPRAA